MTEQKWVRRWNSWIAPKPSKPGVWRRKEGGFLVRGRAVDTRTGKLKEVRFTVQVQDALEAFTLLQEELKKVRDGASAARKRRCRPSAHSPRRSSRTR